MHAFTKLYEHYIVLIGSSGHLLYIFQMLKIIKTGSAHDLSLGGFFISFISLVSWLVYGLLKKDRPLVIVNVIGALAASACICAILIYK